MDIKRQMELHICTSALQWGWRSYIFGQWHPQLGLIGLKLKPQDLAMLLWVSKQGNKSSSTRGEEMSFVFWGGGVQSLCVPSWCQGSLAQHKGVYTVCCADTDLTNYGLSHQMNLVKWSTAHKSLCHNKPLSLPPTTGLFLGFAWHKYPMEIFE